MHEAEGMPAWYWSRGLHDAEIMEVSELTLPVDWKAGVRRWNCLSLRLDCRGALFETDIRHIHFHNYKILLGDLRLLCEPHTWWISDRLATDEKGYRLIITFESSHGDRSELHIRFEDVTVERKPKK